MLLIMLLAAWFARESNLARAQRKAVEAITNAGGKVWYDDQAGEFGNPALSHRRSSWQQWVMLHLGDDYVRTVREVDFPPLGVNREQPGLHQVLFAALANLSDSARLNLCDRDLDDADLSQLRDFPNLTYLDISNNARITDTGLGWADEKSILHWLLAHSGFVAH